MKKVIALPSRYTYIAHHANTYGNVPLWVAMNAFNVNYISLLTYLHVVEMYALMENASFPLKLMRQYQTLSYIKN